MALLSEVVDICGGGTPSKKISEYWDGPIPWASVKDFKSTVLEKTENSITELGVKNSATNVIPAGTIVAPTRMAVGKVAMLGVDMAINQDLKALLIKDESVLDKRYLLRFIESQSSNILKHVKGATVKGITLDVLRDLEIPLLSLTEQKRIATILDKADAIRRKRQQAIQLADDFLRSVFLDMFGDPVTNPKRWEVRTLGEVSTFENGDRSSNYPSGEDIVKSGVLFLSTKNIVYDTLDLRKVQFITADKFSSLSRGKVKKGDLIITLRGTLGACCIFDCEYEQAFINAQMMIIRPNDLVKSTFLHDLLVSKAIKAHLQSLGQGGAVPQLTANQLKELRLPIPSIDRQVAYATVRKVIFGLLDKMPLLTNKGLFDSLSQKAFSGRL